MTHYIRFKVAARSANTNPFGLRGHIFVSRTGLAVEVALNHLNELQAGTEIRVPVGRRDIRNSDTLAGAVAQKTHGEIPRGLEKCPSEFLKEVWK